MITCTYHFLLLTTKCWWIWCLRSLRWSPCTEIGLSFKWSLSLSTICPIDVIANTRAGTSNNWKYMEEVPMSPKLTYLSWREQPGIYLTSNSFPSSSLINMLPMLMKEKPSINFTWWNSLLSPFWMSPDDISQITEVVACRLAFLWTPNWNTFIAWQWSRFCNFQVNLLVKLVNFSWDEQHETFERWILGLAMCSTPGPHCGFASSKAAVIHKKKPSTLIF